MQLEPEEREVLPVGAEPQVSAGDILLDRIRARREAIESREGMLSESFPIIRSERESG